MTKQSDILNDTNYRPVLDHGFVGIVDTMGSDHAVVQAARVSYGSGTKTVREDRGLIRYLVREKHTSPIEMCEVKIHVKAPIFVARQWIRHRTASINEYSGRYSIMSDEFYVPEFDALQPQSTDNKQGRAGELSQKNKAGAQWLIEAANTNAHDVYEALYKAHGDHEHPEDAAYGAYDDDGLLDTEFPGIARELARIVLPVSNYSEFYWKQNLHNMLHLMKLRTDSHAQKEIRAFADALLELIKPRFPLVVEAWEDYIQHGVSLSRMDVALMRELLGSERAGTLAMLDLKVEAAGGEGAFAEAQGMSLREFRTFRSRWNV
jgi:thymidylate synthase (FAD)